MPAPEAIDPHADPKTHYGKKDLKARRTPVAQPMDIKEEKLRHRVIPAHRLLVSDGSLALECRIERKLVRRWLLAFDGGIGVEPYMKSPLILVSIAPVE